VNPYRETAYAVGDTVEFVDADGFHLPFGPWPIESVHTDGSLYVANGWAFPWDLRRASTSPQPEKP
jgi:hypothetical protein